MRALFWNAIINVKRDQDGESLKILLVKPFLNFSKQKYF